MMATTVTVTMLAGLVLVALTLAACTGRDASSREVNLMLAHLDLPAAPTVADIGAGPGTYALALARRLGPDSRVLATEIEPAKVARISRQAVARNLDNVRAIQAAATSTGLPDACCDAIFLRGVYHHLTDPAPVLADVYRALRPGGRLLVIDFPPTLWLKPWTPKNLPADRTGHGIVPETVTQEAGAAGLVPAGRVDDWPGGPFQDLYGLVFQKPSAADAGA